MSTKAQDGVADATDDCTEVLEIFLEKCTLDGKTSHLAGIEMGNGLTQWASSHSQDHAIARTMLRWIAHTFRDSDVLIPMLRAYLPMLEDEAGLTLVGLVRSSRSLPYSFVARVVGPSLARDFFDTIGRMKRVIDGNERNKENEMARDTPKFAGCNMNVPGRPGSLGFNPSPHCDDPSSVGGFSTQTDSSVHVECLSGVSTDDFFVATPPFRPLRRTSDICELLEDWGFEIDKVETDRLRDRKSGKFGTSYQVTSALFVPDEDEKK